ncbi:MAG: transcription-repair coupling factor [Planctomycetota bacterium]|nr:MAG: transcription-repair coupling factor [Planctomycetota bacterium]
METVANINQNISDSLNLKELFSSKSPPKNISGITGAFGHIIIAEFLRSYPKTLVVMATYKDVHTVAYNLSQMQTSPHRTIPKIDYQVSLDSYKNRKALNDISNLLSIAKTEQTSFLTSIETLQQPNINIDNEIEPLELEIDHDYDFDFLREEFLKRGFIEEEFVTLPGEFSVRGGIIDFFSHKFGNPIRLDFFGDTIEDIKTFDPETQRSSESLRKISLTDIHFEDENDLQLKYLLDEFDKDYNVLLVHDNELVQHSEKYYEKINRSNILYYENIQEKLEKFQCTHAHPYKLDNQADNYFQSFVIPKKKGSLSNYLSKYLDKGLELQLSFTSKFEKNILQKELAKNNINTDSINFINRSLSNSFYCPTAKVAFISDLELFNKKTKISNKGKYSDKPLEEFLELNEGDYVVHSNHGIGINRGIQSLQLMGRFEDFLCIEFAEKVKVYVPLMNVGLIQKYIGGNESKPALSKLGSKAWINKKKKAKKEVEDIAHQLLSIQAKRKKSERNPYPIDEIEYNKFCEEFPFEETPDQSKAIESILADMASNSFMDRIICGDVGFGKTEIAMRASYIASLASTQVAILAPTTILVEQHYKSFGERFKNAPVIIERVSRFTNTKDLKRIKERLSQGSIDILIGTHKLLSKDFRFNNLGLLIIDEEQRFGVKQKEKLKSYRSEIDLLTLSATPIPRTLHMSLIGIKDISILATPPTNRLPIDSKVCKYDEQIIKNAIKRELERNGQVYFVHNRIAGLPGKRAEIQELVPESKISTCHGQLPEDLIEETMGNFVNGKINVLISTTIIESGLDIPNANTIIIDYANMYGLSQLHQMRGRIGRSDRQGYALMMIHEGKKTTRKAEKRLKAIEEHTDLGAGFNLSVADMEIRGVGNLLGSDQHGSVASVGYEMYCQLLEECIKELQKDNDEWVIEVELKLNIPSYLPEDFIYDTSEKLKLYRRLHRCRTHLELEDFKFELEDRFGELPEEVENLIKLIKIKLLCQILKIESIETKKDLLKINLSNYQDLELAQILRKLPNVEGLSTVKLLSVSYDDEPSTQFVIDFLNMFIERIKELKENYVET